MSDEMETRPPRGLYTEEEVAQYQASEAREVLKGLLRSLEEVRAQRGVVNHQEPLWAQKQRQGELWGLDVAIQAVKRRLR